MALKERIEIRASAAEKARFEKAAHDVGLVLSEWIRETLLAATKGGRPVAAETAPSRRVTFHPTKPAVPFKGPDPKPAKR